MEDESVRTVSSGVDRGVLQFVQSRQSEDGVTDNGYYNSAGTFVKYSQSPGGANYPAYYQQPTSFLRPASSFAPRRMQLSMRLDF
jgi:hypothetical protein